MFLSEIYPLLLYSILYSNKLYATLGIYKGRETINNTNMKETMKEAGYKYIRSHGYNSHELENQNTGLREMWYANKNHASYGIVYKNTHLEFGYTISQDITSIAIAQ